MLISILVQEVVYSGDFHYIAGEWIVFLVLCIYMLSACMKNGIWDRHLKYDGKTNAICSLIAGLVSGAAIFLMIFKNFPDKPVGAAAGGLFVAAGVFFLCFLFLTVSANAMKKKQAQLEAEDPETEE